MGVMEGKFAHKEVCVQHVYRYRWVEQNKTKDWALVQNAALVIDVKELKLGYVW